MPTPVTRVVQIAPEIGPGSGVAGVAHHLEQAWIDAGVQVSRFTMREARGSWLPQPGGGASGKLAHLARVVWFSVVGTWLAGRMLASDPSVVSVCHNDATVGDVYVNHGLLTVAMRSRGRYRWRMLRNPTHLYTALRDRRRYGPRGRHRVIVNLTTVEDDLLRREYPRLATPTRVIGNGVDLVRFRPADAAERTAARAELGYAADHYVLLFVGREFDRKGLHPLLAALTGLPDRCRLLVVGGTSTQEEAARRRAAGHGVADRVRFVGSHRDARPFFWAADALVTPSRYESYGLVVLEALATGLPVVSSRTGCSPDLIREGVNGWLTDVEPDAIAAAVREVMRAEPDSLRRHARASAEEHSWSREAARYLELVEQVAASRSPGR